MYLDSNILLAQVLDNHDNTNSYEDSAFRTGGLVRSEVLVEFFGEAERLRCEGGAFDDAAKVEYRKELADMVLSWQQSGNVLIEDGYALAALHLMFMLGLKYTDCLLGAIAVQDDARVATSDKELISQLGRRRWEPTKRASWPAE